LEKLKLDPPVYNLSQTNVTGLVEIPKPVKPLLLFIEALILVPLIPIEGFRPIPF
jgi:hypothetical protein